MGLGTPVIASAIGGLEELIMDGVDGILVPPNDPAALAIAILSLMRDGNLGRSLSSSASMRSHSDLAWSSIADETVRLYQHCLRCQLKSGVASGCSCDYIGQRLAILSNKRQVEIHCDKLMEGG